MNIEIELQLCGNFDLLEVYDYHPGEDKRKKWKLKNGIPYWLINSDGVIEPHHYITTDATDLEELGDALKKKKVYITKKREFKNGRKQ